MTTKPKTRKSKTGKFATLEPWQEKLRAGAARALMGSL